MKKEYQKRAERKYRRESVKEIKLRFYGEKDKELYEKAHSLGSTGIKEMISRA